MGRAGSACSQYAAPRRPRRPRRPPSKARLGSDPVAPYCAHGPAHRFRRHRQHGPGDGAAPSGSRPAGAGCTTSMPAASPAPWPRAPSRATLPTGLGAACDCVIVAVVDAAQTEAVLFGADGVGDDAAAPAACVMLCPTLGPASVEDFAARLGGPRHRLHRRADVGRPGARPRRQHEPDGGVRRRRSSRATPHCSQRCRATSFASASGSATARAPSSSTTCSRPSTWPVRPRRWPWPSASASMRPGCSA